MKKVIVFLFILLQCISSYGQKVTTQAPKLVAVGENFSIVFSVSARADRITPPSLADFKVIAGPVPGYNRVDINGQVTESTTSSYFVEAVKEGKFTIGQAEAIVNGSTYKSEPITIEVVAQQRAAQQVQQGQQQTAQSGSTNIEAGDLYTRVELSRSSLYRGESLVATVKIYVKSGIGLSVTNIKLPSFTGFFSQDMDVPESEAKFHRENVNGRIYNVAVIKRNVLIPQQLGTIIISPAEMSLLVQVAKSRHARGLIDDFFDIPYDEVEKKIASPSLSVTVKDLPAGAPASFKGAVGNFKMETSVDKAQTQANQALAYTLTISGTGNLKLVEQPKINFPPDFDKYDTKVNDNVKTTVAGNIGSKRFEYALIPRSAGDFTIPAVEFSYFDPAKETYTTLKSQDIAIHVDKDPIGGGAANSITPGVNQQDIRHLGQDILFIKTTPLIASAKGQLFFGTSTFYLLLAALFIVFLVVYFILKKRVKESGNIALMRNKTANKVAHKRLKLSSKLLKEGNTHGFYEELLRAMWGYVSDKLNIPVARLSRDNAEETLHSRNASPEGIDTFLKVIDECEFARYAPSSGRSEMEQIFNNAITTISKFEQTIR